MVTFLFGAFLVIGGVKFWKIAPQKAVTGQRFGDDFLIHVASGFMVVGGLITLWGLL